MKSNMGDIYSGYDYPVGFSIENIHAFTGKVTTRTKYSYPYSYDPFTVWGSKEDSSDGVYSDRLFQWDHEKYNKCCKLVWGNEGQYFCNRTPEEIQKFLQLYFDNTDMELTWVVEGCNASNGYPYWYFGYNTKEITK